ncbi:MAG: ketoacyl-ACP synthase III [Flavobacteriaceae bacterium]|nr:ketoacyl-ACP synthase III [Flavobacteriaceae bacterium]
MNIKITGTGSYIPNHIQKNNDFLNHSFLTDDGTPFEIENKEIIEKFSSITGIKERRYAAKDENSSDLAAKAAKRAILDSGTDQETIDYIIVAHNFGDTAYGLKQSNPLPSVASKVKSLLNIKNPKCVAYDILFGCPGWIEAVIQAKSFIMSGMAKKCLVIGAETLSRVVDVRDRDSMIFADGAGATLIEGSDISGGILSHESVTHTYNGEVDILFFGESYESYNKDQFIKMQGRKVYEFALSHVPEAMKSCLNQSGVEIQDLKKIFIHQANEKMDEAIVKRFYRLYKKKVPESVLPMNIEFHGNSSVATIPTLFDQVLNGEKEGHHLAKGDVILFASVGAGMNINAITYQI